MAVAGAVPLGVNGRCRLPIADRRSPSERLDGPCCGWPYDRFYSRRQIGRAVGPRVDASWAACWSAGGSTCSWHCFAIRVIGRAGQVRIFIVCLRLRAADSPGDLRPRYQTPISFWGRIRTVRWIIPGYDQVFVGPLLLAHGRAVPCCLPCARFRDRPVDLGHALASGRSFFVALITPPSLRTGD